MKIDKIKINKIEPDPHYDSPNPFFEDRELTEHIDKMGLISSILVVKRGNGGFRLVDGHRRVASAKALGWTEIKAIINEK